MTRSEDCFGTAVLAAVFLRPMLSSDTNIHVAWTSDIKLDELHLNQGKLERTPGLALKGV
jgi:hypothetical protein